MDNKPITVDFCRKLGMDVDGRHASIRSEDEVVMVDFGGNKLFVSISDYEDRVCLTTVNTQDRLVHLFKALGLEVPG